MNGAGAIVSAADDPEITGLTADSRLVQPGFLFAALPGSKADGRAFVGEAIARGAVAVLAPTGTRLPSGVDAQSESTRVDASAGPGSVILIEDDRPRRRFAKLAARFHGRQPRVVAAVTGTNGKTSTVIFLRQLWQALGRPAAALGTLGLIGAGGALAAAETDAAPAAVSMTTPDPVALHRMLAELAGGGIEHLAMEASSHGLHQDRLDGVRVTAAGFTNLSRDHLDYHGDMDAYLAAKARLFGEVLCPGGTAVINADAPEADVLSRLAVARGARVWTYGRAGRELCLTALDPRPDRLGLTLSAFGREVRLEVPLAGVFQAWNLMCALGLAAADCADPVAAMPVLGAACAGLEGVPGRLQKVAETSTGAPVFVDYAHTPDALETVLSALRPHAECRLLVVFGCGGDRDPGKRPLMGAIAARLAERVIVTDDNPRSEPPPAIRAAVLAAAPGAVEIGDRRAAIRAAIAEAQAGDVVLIAGKGHERGQTVGTETRPFEDAAEARCAVQSTEARCAVHATEARCAVQEPQA